MTKAAPGLSAISSSFTSKPPLPLETANIGLFRLSLVEDGVLAVQWGMSGALVIQSLKDKRSEIHGRIAAYEAQIAQARHDLAHVSATIRLFTEPEHQRARYMVSHGFFKKGEIADVCVRHLGVDGEMTTRELAERVMAERKLDASDRTLRNSVVFKVVQALRHARRRKLVGWSRSARVCASGPPATQSRCALSPVALPGPADGRSESPADQAVGERAVALTAMIL